MKKTKANNNPSNHKQI